MPNYTYKARDKYGKLVHGKITSDTKQSVVEKLKKVGYIPVSISEHEVAFISKFIDKLRGVSLSELNMFTRQFHALQKAGLPILSNLNALKEQAPNRALIEVLNKIIKDITAGSSLSVAMSKHPKVFSPLYVNSVKIGEVSGRLDEILGKLVELGDKDEEINVRVKSAMTYPVIVVLALGIAFVVFITLVIPRFAVLYSQARGVLPLPTRILIGTNYLVTRLWWLVFIIVAGSVFVFNLFIRTTNGRLWFDNFKLKFPIFGPLALKLYMSRFARITGTLMHSGVPILQIMDLTSSGVGNIIISNTIKSISMSVREGSGMAGPMSISGMFPAAVVQMVSVGEETGRVDELLLNAADYYDQEVYYTITRLTALIEPVLIVILGSAVLFIALAIFLPMWNMISLYTNR